MARLNNWPWRHWAQCKPESPALIVDGMCLNWQQLAQRIDRLAVGFRQQGVRVGSGVVLKGRNSEATLLAYLALLQCGARLLPLNPQLPDLLLRTLLPSLNIDFSLCLDAPILPLPILPLRMTEKEGYLQIDWEPESIATLTLTSGSSGPPKAAAHTFTAHLANAAGVTKLLGFTASDRWLLSLPLFHVSGQGIVWRWLLVGASLVLQDNRTLTQALKICSFASLVPTQLWRILQQNRGVTSLTTVLLGGAPCATTLIERAEKAGVRCWYGYGMTEAASTITAKRANGREGVGIPLEGREVSLVDGEIWLRSAILSCGYWQNGTLQPVVDNHGWLHTRDRGCWYEGELQVIGRLDNQFFSGGEGIQPEQIEQVLLQHPAVSQVFIIPQDDREFGQRPVALVEIRDGLSVAVLAEWAKSRLAGFQQPVAWYLLPASLNNGGIKISRQSLRQWLHHRSEQGGTLLRPGVCD
ncbi:O-succinylbenzoic acid--CoA ligase [[Pantoea] beijingensis]|uniref:O-succinylbenzoic acid--CoA ligase n=1 Tax=[Pantoea] beijingensis TaxID=1324864 RepID=A0A443IBP6_9GAMM|nr:o-succinylbenzoate--CoA ligase [[Pantoea] beijingensis]RWR01316.1 O-succinylbenzoic acid--CoA ligase [[Pantoea] beijingensis]